MLSSLLRLGFDHVARVGNLGSIKPSLLPYSVHYKGGSNEQTKILNVSFLLIYWRFLKVLLGLAKA